MIFIFFPGSRDSDSLEILGSRHRESHEKSPNSTSLSVYGCFYFSSKHILLAQKRFFAQQHLKINEVIRILVKKIIVTTYSKTIIIIVILNFPLFVSSFYPLKHKFFDVVCCQKIIKGLLIFQNKRKPFVCYLRKKAQQTN